MLTRHDIPSNKLNYLRVLQAVNQKGMNLHDVSKCVKSEASRGYRLVRYLNSPAFPPIAEVIPSPRSLALRRAWRAPLGLARGHGLHGRQQTQRTHHASADPSPFLRIACAPRGTSRPANDLFLLGLLSAVDVILDIKMQGVVHEIAIDEETAGPFW